MPVDSRSRLFAALGAGNFDALVGTHESEWLDFKKQPYHLAEDKEKLELVKDVTAFANEQGGVIVVGVRTEKDSTTASDIAAEVSPVPNSMVNLDQYHQVLETWAYPPVRNANLEWWSTNGTVGLLTIDVPAIPRGQDPILVARTDHSGSRDGALVGIYRRSGSRVTRLSVGEIHQLLRDGVLIQRSGWPLPGGTPPPRGPIEEERRARLVSDTRDAELETHRRYFLQAWPDEDAEVRNLHSAEMDGLRYVLGHPPEIRQYGFGLRTYEIASVVPSGAIRTLHAGRQILSLQRNGLLTWVVTAGRDFLAWAAENRSYGANLINPFALVESTLEFIRLFSGQVLPRCEPGASSWSIAGGLRDVHEGGDPSLLPGGIYRALNGPKPASENDIDIKPIRVSTNQSAGRAAFLVLREVYAAFGLPETEIPYIHDGQVSEDMIRTGT